MTNAHGVARDQLRAFVERIERLEEEKKTIADDIKDVYGEAKSMGFDTKVLKKLIGLRKKDEQERQEEELILDTYMAALGMIPQMDMFEDDAPKAKSPAMALQSPRKAAEAVSERTEINQPETADEMQHPGSHLIGNPEPALAAANRPNGEDGTVRMARTEAAAVTDRRDDHLNSPSDDDAFAAVKGKARLANVADVEPSSSAPIAPASHGEAEAPSAERVSPAEGGSAAANTGGDHVDPDHSHAATAGTRINHIVPATPPKTARDFRPHCLKPDACGASGLSHCYSCRRAMENQEEMA